MKKTLLAVLTCACLLMLLAPANVIAAEHGTPMPEAATLPADAQTSAPTIEQPLETIEEKRGSFGEEELSDLEESPECLAPDSDISYAGGGDFCPTCIFGGCDPGDPNACGGSTCGICTTRPGKPSLCLCLYQ